MNLRNLIRIKTKNKGSAISRLDIPIKGFAHKYKQPDRLTIGDLRTLKQYFNLTERELNDSIRETVDFGNP